MTHVDDQSTDHPPVQDRTTGLILFGVLQIVMGIGCALFIPLMLLSLLAGPAAGGAQNVRMLLPAMGIYALMAVLLIGLGIGSIRARRWARALTLVLAWMWLVIGVMTTVLMFVWLPSMVGQAGQAQQVPPQAATILRAVLGVMGCVYLGVPALFIAFYQSAHVKATCEFKDPNVRWTDKCPLPVLALSLLLALGSASVTFSLSSGGVIPFFGIILTGVSAILVILALSVLFAYLAWATYKLSMAAWWVTLVTYAALCISSVATFSRVDLMDFYRASNIPEEQLELVRESGMVEGMNVQLMTGVGFAVLLGFLIWVRKYFVADTAAVAD